MRRKRVLTINRMKSKDFFVTTYHLRRRIYGKGVFVVASRCLPSNNDRCVWEQVQRDLGEYIDVRFSKKAKVRDWWCRKTGKSELSRRNPKNIAGALSAYAICIQHIFKYFIHHHFLHPGGPSHNSKMAISAHFKRFVAFIQLTFNSTRNEVVPVLKQNAVAICNAAE